MDFLLTNLLHQRITPNFKWSEMFQTSRCKLEDHFATANLDIVLNLLFLCVYTLQPLRDLVGPITVTSGYRSKFVNQCVGGVSHSQHLRGMAADLKFDRSLMRSLPDILSAHSIPFDQCILEKCDTEGFPSWIHISYRPIEYGKNRFHIIRT